MHIESVVATIDAHPRGSDAAAHSAAAAAAGSAVSAAAASPVDASLAQELAAVQQRITAVEQQIIAVEADIVVAETVRDGCAPGSELRKEHSAKLERLTKKEERLGREKELLLKKEERLALKHTSTASSGQCTPLLAPRALFHPPATYSFCFDLMSCRSTVALVGRMEVPHAGADAAPGC